LIVAALEYSQPNLVDVLQETNKQLQRIDLEYQQIDQALQNIDQQLQIGIAHNYNYSIVRCNSLYAQSSQSLMPLQKTVSPVVPLSSYITTSFVFQVPGCGHAIARLIANAKARQTFKNRFRAGEDPAEIGSTPPNFNPKVEHYQHIDILEMVVFYNESFGITAGDTLSNRIMKFKRFLTEV
jgi:hypothetical protein